MSAGAVEAFASPEPILLNEATIKAIAREVVEQQGDVNWMSKPVFTPEEAMRFAGFKSLPAFYEWAASEGIPHLRRGAWGRRSLEMKLGIGGAR